MAATRVMSLAECVWLVRAVDVASIESPSAKGDTALRDALGHGIRAIIPGCVHHALIDAKLIDTPDIGDAEERLQWIGRTEWEYHCEFDWAGAEDGTEVAAACTELVLDGLDTVAAIELNGTPVGNAASFFFPHRFAIAQTLRAGRNELVIRFAPPLRHIREEESRLGSRPWNGDESGWDPFTFIRKPACNFGWDWGPKVATVGIAGGVRIEVHAPGGRIEHVRPLVTRADADIAEVRVHVDAEIRAQVSGGEEPHVVITLREPGDGGTVVAHGRGVFTPDDRSHTSVLLGVADPELWWPRGYGPQSAEDERQLYELRVELRDGDCVLDSWKGRIGLRTVALDTSCDKWGRAFTLRVNGQPVFCMGANWIPEGLFAGYAGEEVIRTRVRDAAEMNANMVRVWGGGLYEPACFYDECDKLGLMVWQDFMFSCGMYPEEPPFGSENGLIAREARYQLARLSSHASVVLWCGGNETVWGHDKWGWRERLKVGQSWGRGLWLEMLPRLCAELDPSRPYWPNSPWSGVDEEGKHRDVLNADHGDRHTWENDAWGPRPESEGFRSPNASGVPRFCSEFGQQSPSCLATLKEQAATSPTELARRQRGPGGDPRWYDGPLAAMFGEPGTALRERDRESEGGFARWHCLAQVLQARAVARGIEWHRVNRPRCGGVLFWQLNDCWAGHSWSAVDAAGRKKPLWYAARRAMSPRLLSVHVVDGAVTLFAVNDTDIGWEGEVVARRVAFDGATLASHRGHVRIGPRVAGAIFDLGALLGAPSDPKSELLVAEADGFTRAVFFHLPDCELAYPKVDRAAALDLRASGPADGGSANLHVLARTLIRDLVLGVGDGQPNGSMRDNMLTFLPGEEATVKMPPIPPTSGWPVGSASVQWVNQAE